MPITQETKPVRDSVPKVDNEIAVGSDLEFQRSWWRFERIAWTVLSVILIADLAGVFGRGPLANAQKRAADGSIHVKYERIERYSTPSILTVSVAQSAIHDGKFQLWVSDNLVKPLGNQRVVPQPAESALENGGIRYTFPVSATPASVEFSLQPGSAGIDHLRLNVPGASPVELTIAVVP